MTRIATSPKRVTSHFAAEANCFGYAAVMLLLTTPWSVALAEEPLSRYQFREPQMGVDCTVTLYAPSAEVANDAARRAFARIAALNAVFSDYDETSEIRRRCASATPGQWEPISDDLHAVLSAALELSQRTEGAFDVTVGPLVGLWRKARRTKTLPTAEAISAAQQRIGYRHVTLADNPPRMALSRADLQFDFGGIAKGYAAQAGVTAIAGAGVSRCLVALAGDIAAGDPPPDAPGWKVGIAPLDRPDGTPSRYLKLSQAAVSTSGDAFQFVEINGVRYSHIVDPKTGLGLTQRCSVTVVAPTGLLADGLDTAAVLVGRERGMNLIEATPRVAGLMVFQEGDRFVTHETARLSEWLWPEPSP